MHLHVGEILGRGISKSEKQGRAVLQRAVIQGEIIGVCVLGEGKL
jgi:hypothetical protein